MSLLPTTLTVFHALLETRAAIQMPVCCVVLLLSGRVGGTKLDALCCQSIQLPTICLAAGGIEPETLLRQEIHLPAKGLVCGRGNRTADVGLSSRALTHPASSARRLCVQPPPPPPLVFSCCFWRGGGRQGESNRGRWAFESCVYPPRQFC